MHVSPFRDAVTLISIILKNVRPFGPSVQACLGGYVLIWQQENWNGPETLHGKGV